MLLLLKVFYKIKVIKKYIILSVFGILKLKKIKNKNNNNN